MGSVSAMLFPSRLSTGGTNLHVCLVTLQGELKFKITQSKYRIIEERKHEDGQKLFDFCAECFKTFVDTNLSGQKKLWFAVIRFCLAFYLLNPPLSHHLCHPKVLAPLAVSPSAPGVGSSMAAASSAVGAAASAVRARHQCHLNSPKLVSPTLIVKR